ncbi:MAG: aminoacyl-tRNA hydrolase [Armatimonadota bacterium]|nr:aminoacyl-tRNA hydrolase [Armatimonadota bacterium]MDR7401898.1 aminoacyl-tRNA hydrolase [Armatimonadota bacterium]MDR7404521.1 aminoacyl-tRNA hydrolase [Armatimonadota bacterium]MDR7438135.1 aminoacyl-tRNA hydrolase [Armatimonadota bacterium]MDR7471551.1 aminoacyl-tRNA hydrolase [Armatimonadota bacterium]
MTLVVGLGNPGRRYRGTRHNVGWEVLDRLARRLGVGVDREEGWALVGMGRVGRRRVLLAKPQTFVNLSGTAVDDLRRRHRIRPEEILVILDDLDLPLGRLRVRPRGSHGGHRGLRSILEALGTEDVPRLRIGIGRPPAGVDPADFVLTPFTPEERAVLEPVLERAAEAAEVVVRDGLEVAMTRFNAPVPV